MVLERDLSLFLTCDLPVSLKPLIKELFFHFILYFVED